MHKIDCYKQQWAAMGKRLNEASPDDARDGGIGATDGLQTHEREELSMSWQNQLDGDPLAWLLAPDSPGVRYLALRDLLDMPSDNAELRAAAQAAHTEGPIAAILAHM